MNVLVPKKMSGQQVRPHSSFVRDGQVPSKKNGGWSCPKIKDGIKWRTGMVLSQNQG